MNSYTSFARVYDDFMDNVPYDEWANYLSELLRECGINDGLILDMGCGTGSLTRRLADCGYDMLGLDSSEEMLAIAREKGEEQYPSILYLWQDMREMELYGTVRGIVSSCDSVNYILTEEELLDVFRLVNNYLDPAGIFIFDINTSYKYQHILADSVIAEDRDDISFIWENYYDEETEINEYDLSLFLRLEGDTYQKFTETHFQRAYSLETVEQLLMASGLKLLAVYDGFTKSAPRSDSERLTIVTMEQGKSNKEKGE